jgi:uncharacterized protein YcbK (DUF882 family)
MSLLPPSSVAARLDSSVFQKSLLARLPALEVNEELQEARPVGRRAFLAAAQAAMLGFALPAIARPSAEPLTFSPDDEAQAAAAAAAAAVTPGAEGALPAVVQAENLKLGEIPADFWYRPRELWLRRQGTRDDVKVVYWKDGQLVAEGYWRACAVLRDVRANVMTAIDPSVLDILRGILGYYQAWNWPHPVVATSGFRTVATNNALSAEGSAKNSMHLYGRAVDLFIPGIPSRDVAALGVYLKQGGVGFYPDRGFTHLDTGRLRLWRGK